MYNVKKVVANHSKNFIQPVLLLLMSQGSSHGYELMDKLKAADYLDSPPDTAVVYRTLRKFEKEKLVVSSWVANESGPSKRVYTLKEAGFRALDMWASRITNKISRLQKFMNEYKRSGHHKMQKIDSRRKEMIVRRPTTE